uniref:RDD domain-containing protein n=1 Tax=Meloidogyne hapla TaxID=6305 RepID=A0A1I8BQN6_MELHA
MSSSKKESNNKLFNLPNEVKKDYGSAAAYVQEVHKWSQSVRWCMAYQQMMSSFWTNTFLQQQQAAMLMQQQQALSPFSQRGATIRLNLTRIFRTAGAAPSIPQTIIIQQFEIPSFFRRIAAEAIDSIILFVFKLLLVYTLVEADLIDLDQFESILTAHADLQTLIDVTQGLFSVELFFKLIVAVIEALCITYGMTNIPIGCTPGKKLLGIKVISCLDVQPVVGSPDRVAITSFAFIDFKRYLKKIF